MGTAGRFFRSALWAVAFFALVLAGCSRGPKAEESADDQAASPSTAQAVVQSQAVGEPLEIQRLRDTVVCDGSDQDVGQIQGALPGELLLFSSPVPIDIKEATADATGAYQLRWNCEQNEARLQWKVTATGHDSGSAVTFTVVGAETDSLSDGGLTVDVTNSRFVCDGLTRRIGRLSGAAPNEQVNFSSPESAGLKPGDADQYGDLWLNWECEPDDVGTTWNVTAVGVESGRTVSFAVAGIGVVIEDLEPLTVEVLEEPFLCNGESRYFATISNLNPLEVVDFSSPEATSLIDGRAEGDGTLPIRWQCGLEDVGKTWNLTATGTLSQRSITVTVTGAAPPAGAVTELTVVFTENPFACDGVSRPFGLLANFTPGEFVDFSSPQSPTLRQGQADQVGELPIRWQCGAGDIDMIWDLTATGTTSDKSITFRITGASPPEG